MEITYSKFSNLIDFETEFDKPFFLIFQEATRKDVVLIPMGQSLDWHHEENERLSIRNFMMGTKVFASYMLELAALDQEDSEVEDARQLAREKWRRSFW